MTERGSAFLLKVGTPDKEQTYSTVAGLRTQKLAISGEPVATSPKDTGWRELLGGAGVRSVSLSASGIFTGSAAEISVKKMALEGTIDDYELSFESGDRLRGRFLITQLEYIGDYNGERNYLIALESSGEVVTL
jgi:TP901-1 family phage major tail protein